MRNAQLQAHVRYSTPMPIMQPPPMISNEIHYSTYPYSVDQRATNEYQRTLRGMQPPLMGLNRSNLTYQHPVDQKKVSNEYSTAFPATHQPPMAHSGSHPNLIQQPVDQKVNEDELMDLSL